MNEERRVSGREILPAFSVSGSDEIRARSASGLRAGEAAAGLRRFVRAAAAVAGALAAAAGATTPAPDPAAAAGRARLDAGVASYEQGRFDEAIGLLSGSAEIDAAPLPIRVEALKTLAFSQCVTGRSAPCRRSFDALLAIDPAFVLTPAESGHPTWGPVFEQARRVATHSAAAASGTPAAATAVAPATAATAAPAPASVPAVDRAAVTSPAGRSRAVGSGAVGSGVAPTGARPAARPPATASASVKPTGSQAATASAAVKPTAGQAATASAAVKPTAGTGVPAVPAKAAGSSMGVATGSPATVR